MADERDQQTDRQTDRQDRSRYSICSNRLHLAVAAMQPNITTGTYNVHCGA